LTGDVQTDTAQQDDVKVSSGAAPVQMSSAQKLAPFFFLRAPGFKFCLRFVCFAVGGLDCSSGGASVCCSLECAHSHTLVNVFVAEDRSKAQEPAESWRQKVRVRACVVVWLLGVRTTQGDVRCTSFCSPPPAIAHQMARVHALFSAPRLQGDGSRRVVVLQRGYTEGTHAPHHLHLDWRHVCVCAVTE
jgi:hypothetical protein